MLNRSSGFSLRAALLERRDRDLRPLLVGGQRRELDRRGGRVGAAVEVEVDADVLRVGVAEVLDADLDLVCWLTDTTRLRGLSSTMAMLSLDCGDPAAPAPHRVADVDQVDADAGLA